MPCHWGVVEKLGLSYLPTIWYRYFRAFLISICIIILSCIYSSRMNRAGYSLSICQNVPVRPSSIVPTSAPASLRREAEEGLLRPVQNYTDIRITRDHHYIESAISKQSSNSPQAQHNHDYNITIGAPILHVVEVSFFSFSFFSFFFPMASSTNCRQRNPSSSNACPRRLHAVSYIIRY